MRKSFKSVLMTGIVCAASLAAGCHSPDGGFMPMTGGSQTWYSTEHSPKTVTLVDKRTNETIFTMDIPVGKQLVIDFNKGEGDDPVHRPDLMRYQVDDIGKKFGRLRNSMTVPGATSREVAWFIRSGIEYAQAPANVEMRTDQAADRPDWWTPDGGPMPDDTTVEMYDN